MQEQYRLLVDEQLICGLQIHVGVSDRDLAVADHAAGRPHLPILLALSASSPFWNGSGHRLREHPDDHLAALAHAPAPPAGSSRPPSTTELLADLINTGVIADAQDGLLRRPALRPRAHPGAAGLRRVPDRRRRDPDRRAVPGLVARGGARDRGRPAVRAGPAADPPGGDLAGGPRRVVRRAARRHPPPATGPGRAGRPCGLLDRLRPQLRGAGRLRRGRRSWPRRPWPAATPPTGSGPRSPSAAELDDVVELVVDRDPRAAGGVCRPRCPALRTYRPRAGDEAVGLGHRAAAGLPRPRRATSARIGTRRAGRRRSERRDAWTDEHGLTFGVERRAAAVRGRPGAAGHQPARVAEPAERPDPAGPGDRVVPGRRVRRAAGAGRRGAARRPRGRRARLAAGGDPAAGRRRPGADHGLRPGPQRVRRLAGAGGQRPQPQRRRVRDRHPGPDGRGAARTCPGPTGLLDPADALPRLPRRPCSRTPGRGSRRGAALRRARAPPPGSSTGCWPNGAVCCWSPPDDLEVRDGRVRHRGTGGGRSTRSTCGWTTSWSTWWTRAGRPIGAAGLRGRPRPVTCVLANAPGNGVADDKAMYCYVPELIGYYLRRAPAAGVGADLPHQRRDRAADRAGAGRRAGHQAGRRPRRARGADRPGRLRAEVARPTGRRSPPTRPAGSPRRWSRCPRTRPSTTACCSPGTSTCGRSSTSAAPRRRTASSPPLAPDPGRPRRQPGRQLAPGAAAQGHLDRRERPTDEGMSDSRRCADWPASSGSTGAPPTSPRCERMNDCLEPPRTRRLGRLGARPGRARPSPAVDHRPERRRLPADGRLAARADAWSSTAASTTTSSCAPSWRAPATGSSPPPTPR